MTALVVLRRFADVPPVIRLADRERPAVCLALVVVSVIACALSWGVVDYDGEMDDVLIILMAAWLCSVVADRCGARPVGDILKILAVVTLSDFAVPLASAALATTGHTLADQNLLVADHALLGVDIWPDVISTFAPHKTILKVLSYAYASIGWQPPALIVALCLSGKSDTAWQFATAWIVSLLLCLLVFPWCPAVGAYAHFHISPAEVPEVLVRSAWHYPATLEGFREGHVRLLNLHALEGIIAMPSFHACASVLLAWGFRHLRGFAIVFASLNAAMWVSSVPIGGHYAVDVLAGTLVGMAGIRFGVLAVITGPRPNG